MCLRGREHICVRCRTKAWLRLCCSLHTLKSGVSRKSNLRQGKANQSNRLGATCLQEIYQFRQFRVHLTKHFRQHPTSSGNKACSNLRHSHTHIRHYRSHLTTKCQRSDPIQTQHPRDSTLQYASSERQQQHNLR